MIDRVNELNEQIKWLNEQFVLSSSESIQLKEKLVNLLDFNYQKKLGFLIKYETVGPNTILTENSQKSIIALLKDQIRSIKQPKQNTSDLKINKLLKAREEDIDFELGIACMITGDNDLFPERSSYYLTKFFKELGFNFEHDKSTKRFWVESKLKELTIEQIYFVITQGIFKRKYFVNDNFDVMQDKDIAEAKKFFAKFLEDSIRTNEIIDLSDAFNLNVNNELLFNQKVKTSDEILNDLIVKARSFFLKGDIQQAVEKIWDALERLKTLLNKDKKEGIKIICKYLSDEIELGFFNDEYQVLTDLGNKYQIRHFETDRKPIKNLETRKYLFFRALSLINLTLARIPKYK